jgi:hypothetical protein
MGKLRRIITKYQKKSVNNKFLKELIYFNGNFKKLKKLSKHKYFDINYDKGIYIYYATLINGRKELIKFILNQTDSYYNYYNTNSYYYNKTLKYIVDNNKISQFKKFTLYKFTLSNFISNNGFNLIDTISTNNQHEMFSLMLKSSYYNHIKSYSRYLYSSLVRTNNLEMIITLVEFFKRYKGIYYNVFDDGHLLSNIQHYNRINIFKYYSDNKYFDKYEYGKILNHCLDDNNIKFLEQILPVINKNYKKTNVLYFHFLYRSIVYYKVNIIKIIANELDVDSIDNYIKKKILHRDHISRLERNLNERLEYIIINDIIKNNDSRIYINTVLTNKLLSKYIKNNNMKYIQPNYKPKKINRTV